MNGSPSRAMVLATLLFMAGGFRAGAQTPPQSDADFAKYAKKLREDALLRMEPTITVPTASRALGVSGKYPWKTGIVTTVFWIGGKSGNASSAWDPKWERSYGGFDNPEAQSRKNFIPANFVPRLNPFYIALPYNDVASGATKPEAKVVIPWYGDVVANGSWSEGQSVCRDRWVAIRSSTGKVCYAQWNDCGPFAVDHWQYVFGNEKPRPNANGGAGLNVSPAVRDYLQLSGTDVADWKFVEAPDVPKGPWALYGSNNPFTKPSPPPPGAAPAAPEQFGPPTPVQKTE